MSTTDATSTTEPVTPEPATPEPAATEPVAGDAAPGGEPPAGPERIVCPACRTVIDPGLRGRGRTRPGRETWPMVQLAVVGSAVTASLVTLLTTLS